MTLTGKQQLELSAYYDTNIVYNKSNTFYMNNVCLLFQAPPQQLHTNGNVNGVALVNGQPPASEVEADNEKWWWVCCLEFCFCLL